MSASMWAAVIGVATMLAAPSALAQSNPVYINDSPRARELFTQVLEQLENNQGEAARLCQVLLDGYDTTLIPIVSSTEDHFVTIRTRVMHVLRANPEVLERYRNLATAEAERQLSAGRIDAVVRTRALTLPGLEALLRDAQDLLERARFRAALNRLDEAMRHPDMDDTTRGHALYMTGVAARYLGDEATYQHSLQQLDLMGRQVRDHFDALSDDTQFGLAPDERMGQTILNPAPVGQLNDLVADAIWSMPLDEALMRRRMVDPPDAEILARTATQQGRIEAPLATSVAAIRGDVVFINEGFRVTACDRFSGAVLWSRDEGELMSTRRGDNEEPLDLNVIVVKGDTLVTLTGHAQETSRSRRGVVLCLDPDTGSKRWARRIDLIGGVEDHDGLFPHGAPILTDGLIIVMARKVTAQLLTSTYVIALDERDGSLVWSRYISSNGGLRQSRRPMSSLVEQDGALVVATAAGAVARLEPASGAVQWLRKFDMPIRFSYATGTRHPWEFSTPVITSRGLIAITPDQERIVLLNFDTGETLESHAANTSDGWNAPRYLLANDDMVFAVGKTVRAFQLDLLDRAIWHLPRPALSVSPVPEGDDDRFQLIEERTEPPTMTDVNIRGRVQLIRGGVVVPTGTDVLVIDDDTGAEITRLTVNQGGNPLTIGSQLFMAGSDRLDAFMSFGRAREMLVERMERSPDDPVPALNLVRLGYRGKNMQLALDATNSAIAIADRIDDAVDADRVRRELFRLLEDVIARGMIETEAHGESVFASMRKVATTPESRVTQAVEYGDWLAQTSPGRAVGVYQTLLSDPVLAGTHRYEGAIGRSAGHWGMQRIDALMREHGAEVYAPMAALAQKRYQEIASKTPVVARALEQVVHEFSIADVSVIAAVAASEQYIERDQPHEAAGVLMKAYRARPTGERAGVLLGRLVALFESRGWRSDAAAVIEYVIAAHGNIDLDDGTAMRQSRQWIASLQPDRPRAITETRARVGRYDSSMEVRVLRGVAMNMSSTDAAVLGHDTALFVDGTRIHSVRASDLGVNWTTEVNDSQPSVLRIDQGRILLWLGGDKDDQRAVMIDQATGALLWSTPRLSDPDVLGDALKDFRTNGMTYSNLPNGERFAMGEVLPRVNDEHLILIQRTGGVIAFDLEDPSEPLWIRPTVLTEVHHAIVNDHSVVLAGIKREAASDGRTTPSEFHSIEVLDIETGQPRRSLDPGQPTGVAWMVEGPLGQLAIGGESGIETVEMFRGESLWSSIPQPGDDSPLTAHRVEQTILTRDQSNQLRSIRFDGTGYVGGFDTLVRGEWNATELRDVVIDRGRIYALYRQRVVRFNRQGNVLGADVLNVRRDYQRLVPCSNSLLLVSVDVQQARLRQEDNRRRTQFSYEIIWLAPDCRTIDKIELEQPLLERVVSTYAVDGWLLMSTETTSYAVPFPFDG